MDFLSFRFPYPAFETSLLIPPLVAFASRLLPHGRHIGGLPAFALQVSFLYFTTPSVKRDEFRLQYRGHSSGVYRYLREGRMAWPLTLVVIIGTLRAWFIGYYLRVLYMPDPRAFQAVRRLRAALHRGAAPL